MMRLLRLLPPETAHNLALWGFRTGLWRVPVAIDALGTLIWTVPVIAVRRHYLTAAVHTGKHVNASRGA